MRGRRARHGKEEIIMATYTLNVNGRQTEVTTDPHAVAVGASRRPENDRHEIRLRHQRLWCVHRAPRRRGDSFMCGAGIAGRRSSDRDDRRMVDDPDRPDGSERLGRSRRRPVRLLSERPDHERRRVAEGDPKADGREDRRMHGRKHLPLRHLCAHSRSHQKGVAAAHESAC